jgi:pimeloyl-ACP methyl ester carboxylesterase
MGYVLVHGGFCGGWVWDDVVDRLAKAGCGARVVDQLPSGGTDPALLGGLRDDTDHVRAMLETIDEPVVLVGHSYGGMVITELADHPKVGHSVYLTAVWPQRGQALLDHVWRRAAQIADGTGGRRAASHR